MVNVSVIIPSYNCAKYIKFAIESALNQTYKDFEIIIIDDGSTDETKELIKPFLERYPEKIVYKYQENSGLVVARNNGIHFAKGKFIALLDADDIWFPDRLEKCIRAIEKSFDIGIVHGNITRIAPDGKILDTPLRKTKYLSGYIFENIFLRKADISCPTVTFRKSCCEDVGYFDLNLNRLGCEDRDLWLRISEKYKVEYIDQVLAYYRVSPNSMSQHLDKMTKARTYVINKYTKKKYLFLLRLRAFGKIYHDLGDFYFLNKQYKSAKKQYLKALSYFPFNIFTWLNLLKSFLM